MFQSMYLPWELTFSSILERENERLDNRNALIYFFFIEMEEHEVLGLKH